MTAKKQQQADENSKPPPIKLVKSKKAYKLAMQWVSDMSGGWEDELAEVELKGRPPRVGLGAEISRKIEVRQSNNEATEWKLRAVLVPHSRKASIHEESVPNVKNTSVSDDEEDESESRCNSFTKKGVNPPITSVQGKKKRRK